MSEKGGSKVKHFFTDVKTHWTKPAPGKYVPYREYLDILIGNGSNYVGKKTLEYLTFAASCYLMMYHYQLPYLTFSIIALINMPLNYIQISILFGFLLSILFASTQNDERETEKFSLLHVFSTSFISKSFKSTFILTSISSRISAL